MQPPVISRFVLAFFRNTARRYFRRHFHAVRLSGADQLAAQAKPLLVYANHSSWWDPMVATLLAEQLLPGRRHYAPMDAASLERYRILKKIGIFPVEMATARGAVQFLRTGEAVLRSGGVLWVTPEGRFVDARERPRSFKPGLAGLAVRVAPCTVQPLAIEYVFWDERLPECLLRLGKPVQVAAGESAEAVEARLVAALEGTMDELRELALTRSNAGFTVLERGALGVGGAYGLGKRLWAALRGQPYAAEHTAAAAVAQAAVAPRPEPIAIPTEEHGNA
ncbi:MAG: lysophospholipid acyltransferase family protein [Acidobacteriota bacterium]|nr:lysophospholipid acyltransferase family protein [Acidobacteriota bacterium]